MVQFEEQWTEVGGLRIYAAVSTRRSDRPPVVLIHGSGLSGAYMMPTAKELARDLTVYVPDMPGFGDSDKPPDVWNVRQLASFMAAWSRVAVGTMPVVLLGNSFGCQVIGELAARYPEQVAAAVLQGPTTPPDERRWYWQFIRWRQNQRYNPASLNEPTWEAYKRCGIRRLFWSFQDQLTDRLEEKAPRIPAPVLVVRGAEDPIAHERWCEQLTRVLPRGQLVLIPKVAHTLVYTAPRELAQVTAAFIDDVLSSDARASG